VYESFYGLSASPFRLSPDPEFFFNSQGHKKAMAYLRYGLNQKEGFIVVTGTPGTGKTTLARSLLQESGQGRIVVSELNTTHLEAEDVLRMVAASFGLEHENLSKASLLKRLESFFIARFRAGCHVLLMVDEAQNLPKSSLEELRMLSNFYLGNHALLQIFLLGQEQFKDILYSQEMEQLRQRVVAACHLEPFNARETKEYIEHRLSQVGWTDDPLFLPAAYRKIYALTKGIPRRINTFCERLLLYGSIEELHEFDVTTIDAVGNELMYEVAKEGESLADIEPNEKPSYRSELDDDSAFDESDQQDSALDATLIVDSSEVGGSLLVKESLLEETRASENEELEIQSLSKASANDEIGLSDQIDDSPLSTEAIIEAPKSIDSLEANSLKEILPDSLSQAQVNVSEPADQENSSLLNSEVEPTAENLPNSDQPLLKKRKAQRKKKAKRADNLSTPPLSNVVTKPIASVVPQHNHQAITQPQIADKSEVQRLVASALQFFRKPEQEQGNVESQVREASGEAIRFLMGLAVGKAQLPANVELPLLKGVAAGELKSAMRHFIKHAMLTNKADYYRRLGLLPGASVEEVLEHYKVMFRLFQPDQETDQGQWNEVYTRRVNEAYSTLRDPDKRRAYDDFLKALSNREKKKGQETQAESRAVAKSASNDEYLLKKQMLESDNDADQTVAVDLERVLNMEARGHFNHRLNKRSKAGAYVMISVLILGLLIAAALYLKPSAFDPIMQKFSEIKSRLGLNEASAINGINLNDDNAFSDDSLKLTTSGITKDDFVMPEVEFSSNTDEEISSIASLENQVTTMDGLKNNRQFEAGAITQKKVMLITRQELDRLITKFTSAYEQGALENFMSVFHEKAKTNDRDNKEGIQEDYSSLFNATETRAMEFQDLNWETEQTKAVGNADFVVTVIRKGGSEPRSFKGKITLTVEKQANQLAITSLQHKYGE